MYFRGKSEILYLCEEKVLMKSQFHVRRKYGKKGTGNNRKTGGYFSEISEFHGESRKSPPTIRLAYFL